MDEEKARNLARFRVGKEKHMGKDMADEDMAMRKQFIKTMLRGINPWHNLTPDQILDVRIYKLGAEWYIEDTDYYVYKF